MNNFITAIPTNDKEKISFNFSRCKYFAIHDNSNGEIKYINNEYADIPSGAGIQVANYLLNNNVNRIVTKELGFKAAKIFNEANVKVIMVEELKKIEDIIKDLD